MQTKQIICMGHEHKEQKEFEHKWRREYTLIYNNVHFVYRDIIILLVSVTQLLNNVIILNT